MKQIQVSSRARGQLREGSLWIFANEFKTPVKSLKVGEWVEFVGPQGESLGVGYVNPHSLICGRVVVSAFDLKHEELLQRSLEEIFAAHLKACLEKRQSFKERGCYRLCFSEADSLPGLIVDVYESAQAGGVVCVVQTTTAGMDTVSEIWKAVLQTLLGPKVLVWRADSSIRHLEKVESFNRVLVGDEKVLSLSEFQEDGVYYAADFLEGQKTGFFLDQKENRKFLRTQAQGQNVLDLCCYSGGWGLAALAGGAAAVTFVDQSAEALELARKGLVANQQQSKSGFHSEQKTEFFQADVFEFLEAAVKQNRKFDIVVADPPAFVKSKKNLPQAIKAYEKLNRLALEVLNPGGLLLTCSCSFHLSETDFFNLLLRAVGEERRPLQVVYRAGASTDHPWILQRPETNYLKCLALR